MLNTDNPSAFYPDSSGHPLQNGVVYFGLPGLNPATNPLTVFWDSAGTQPAAQPVAIANGRTVRQDGTPSRIWVMGDYSKLVQDAKGRQVVYETNQPQPPTVQQSVTDRFSGTGAPATFTLSATPADATCLDVYVAGVYQQKNSYTLVGKQLTITAAAAVNNVEAITRNTLNYANVATSIAASLGSASGAAAAATASAAAAAHIYAGTYVTDPTTRPDGTAIQVGDVYFNSTANLNKRYNGATWVASDINTANLAASSGASLVGYVAPGAGAVARTLRDKARDFVSVKDFGAAGDGVADDTAAIAVANTQALALGKALYWPSGTYLATNIAALAGMRWIGEGVGKTIIKLKTGTNAGLVTSGSTNIDDVHIACMTFDGNSAGNTAGDTLTIKGCRTSLVDITVINSAGNGIVTDWNIANAARLTGCEGFFSHITIDSSQQSGWLHHGPSDSHFESVIIIDSGLKTNALYYGIYLFSGAGNGRFFNLHTWNRDATTNVPLACVYVESSGNNFAGCHFEGGNTALTVTGAANTFAACAAYAPRASYSVDLSGSSNILDLALGLTFATANPAYKGVLLRGPNNILTLLNSGSGCTLGAVDFTSDPGENIVKMVGFQSTGTVYNGTPHVTDEVNVAVGGAAGLMFTQTPEVAWTVTNPVPSAGTGAFTTATCTLRYRKMGKTVHFSLAVIITTNGTAAGNVTVTLPFGPRPGLTQTASGRATGISAKTLACNLAGTTINIFNYDGTYPGANGETLSVTGTYEAA